MEFGKKTIIQEWVVFAICLGLGAHVALGFLLHGGLGWSTESYGLYGIFFGISIYVIVQVIRSLWRVGKEKVKP